LALGGDAVTRFHFNAVSAMLAAEGEQKPA
jgi:hypothetical protein